MATEAECSTQPSNLLYPYWSTAPTQTNSWMEGQGPCPLWLPTLLSSSTSLPCPLLILRMEMKHFLCFSQQAAVNVAAPSANNSGQERAPCTSCVGAKHPANTTSLTGWQWRSSIQQPRKLLEVSERASRKELQHTSHHYYLCKTSLLRWKLMGMRTWKENAFLLDSRWQL